MAFMRYAEFSVAAAHDQRHDLVGLLPTRHAGSASDDYAGDFEPWNIGSARRRRIKAHTLHDVGPVNAGCGNLDQDFAAAGLGTGRGSAVNTSGPPGARIAITVMRSGTVVIDRPASCA